MFAKKWKPKKWNFSCMYVCIRVHVHHDIYKVVHGGNDIIYVAVAVYSARFASKIMSTLSIEVLIIKNIKTNVFRNYTCAV